MTLFLFICTFLIVLFLFSKSPRRDYRWLKYAIGAIMIMGIILHWKVIYMIPAYMTPPGTGELNPYSVFVIALTSSAQMFLGSTRIFDNGFQDFLFTVDGAPYLAGLSFLYMASVFISLFAVFNFLFQRIISRWKLKFTFSPRLEDEIHIFFGETNYSRLLINEIPKDKNIIVTTVCPSGMATNKEMKESIKSMGFGGKITTLPVEKVAKISLKALKKRKAIVIPGAINKFLNIISKPFTKYFLAKRTGKIWRKSQQKRNF